jgi:dihydrodipicolinate synthase/N-acetylneuraminate lyase
MEKRYPKTLMTTACVPWTKDFKIDEPLLRKEIDMLMNAGSKSIYLFGTAGEGYAVNHSQYTDLVRILKDQTSKDETVMPMVGVISLSLSDIIDRIEMAAKQGITDFQICFPSWGSVTEDEAHLFFRSVCDRFPELRFMHYNNFMRSKTKLNPDDYVALADEFKNLVAVKFITNSVNEVHQLAALDSPLQFFLLDGLYGYASMLGEFGLLISLLNVSYKVANQYFEAGTNKDFDTCLKIADGFFKGHKALMKNCPPGSGKMDGAWDKTFVTFGIPEFPQSLHPPYIGFTDAQVAAFQAEMKQILPDWF